MIVGVLCTAATCLHAQVPNLNQRPVIVVVGEGKTEVDPNRIEIVVTLSQDAGKGKASMSELDQAFAVAIEQAGIDKKQVAITDQKSSTSKRNTISQYKVYRVVVYNTGEATELFQCLYSNGIATVSLGRTWHTESAKLKQQAKVAAVKEARVIAITLTEAIGQKLGKAIIIQEDDRITRTLGYATNPVPYKGKTKDEESPLIDVKIQKIKFNQNVTVSFELL